MSALASHEADPTPTPELRTVDMRDHFDGITGFYGGPANVVLQLGLPGIGYALVESKVDSGSVMKHPFKRARTTLTYLAVALLGNDEDRGAYAEAVNGSHRHVHSTTESPVKYNAFSRDLQLWVASCLYFGLVDTMEKLHGPLDDETAEAILRECARLGTTLQVPAELWHADVASFQAYWDEHIVDMSFDPPVRDYLLAVLRFEQMSVLLSPATRFLTFMNTGFLPAEFRDALGLDWSDRDEAVFTRVSKTTGLVYRRLPRPLRNFPMNILLIDMRARRRLGRPLV